MQLIATSSKSQCQASQKDPVREHQTGRNLGRLPKQQLRVSQQQSPKSSTSSGTKQKSHGAQETTTTCCEWRQPAGPRDWCAVPDESKGDFVFYSLTLINTHRGTHISVRPNTFCKLITCGSSAVPKKKKRMGDSNYVLIIGESILYPCPIRISSA